MLPRWTLSAYRLFFAILTVTAIVVQYLYVSGRPAFHPVNFFSFFTIESNVFAAVVFLAMVLIPPKRNDSGSRDMIRGAATLYMVTTGIVYGLLLSGLEEALQTQVSWVNLVLHYIMPVVLFLDWLIDPPKEQIALRRALIWIAYPVIYFAYSLVRGPLANWYPYPFLNPETAGGYGGVALYAAAITVALLLLIWILVWIPNLRRRAGVS